jgi:spermidine/putrescine transport system substrate-binding protein
VISRRRLFQGVAGAALLGASARVLPLFSTPSKKQTPESCPSRDESGTQRALLVSNWSGYIDPISAPDSTVRRFERATGIAVTYTEDINDNQEFFAKVANQLGTCQPVERDLCILSNPTVSRMLQLGWLQPLDHDRLPNVRAQLLPELARASFDPDRRYSVPWQSGFTGIAYNARLVREPRSIADLLGRDDLRGRVTLLSDMRDTMGLLLRHAGANPASFVTAEWEAALDLLPRARRRGQIRAFTGNEYLGGLVAGNIAACLAWSSDVVRMGENPDVKFVVPEEGLQFWSDNMVVPNLAAHKANSEAWMNHYYDPEIAAIVASEIKCICPVAGARAVVAKTDPSLVDNPLIFPTPDYLAKTWEFMPLGETQGRLYERDFRDAIGG